MTAERLPPCNVDAEKSVLGSVLLNNSVLDDLATVVRPDDFYAYANKVIFATMLRLREAAKQIDLVTLVEALNACKELVDVGTSYLADLWPLSSPSNVLQHAHIIREKARLRSLVGLGNDLAGNASAPGASSADLIEVLSRQLGDLAQQTHASQIRPYSAVMDDVLRELDRRANGNDDDESLPIRTGWRGLDDIIAGVAPSELVLIAARPRVGKTLIGKLLARNVARRGLPVFFVSLEQKACELGERIIAAEAHVTGRRLRSGILSRDERGRVLDATDRLRPLPITIDDTPGQGMFQISANVRRQKRTNKTRLVVIDYVGLIEPDDRGATRADQVTAISRRLKHLARELDIPIVALAQLNRVAANRKDDDLPQLHDLAESDSLGRDADTVLLLHRKASDPERANGDVDELKVVVAKCRNGPEGVVILLHDKPFYSVNDPAFPDAPTG